MTAAAVSTADAGIAAALVLVAIVLLYRLLRREPLDRIVRLGLFIERKRHGDVAGDESPDDEDVETRQWPRRPPDDPPA